MANTIATRISDFLKDYPPFSLLSREQLEHMAERVVVQYWKPGEFIYRSGEPAGRYVYLVREGAVRLLRKERGLSVLVDQCDEGDLFGVGPLLAGEPYLLTAEVGEETLIYAIPVDEFRRPWGETPKVAHFLAHVLPADATRERPPEYRGRIFPDRQLVEDRFSLVEIQSLERSKEPVTCRPDTPIREAATTMSAAEVGSIVIVNNQGYPLGIMTDKDLRRKVATGLTPLEAPVSEIMSSPVVTLPPTVTVADAQMVMIRSRIHHLCLTEDGSRASPVMGVISEHDILVVQGNNPAVLIRETGRCRSGADLRHIRERAEELLKKYIYQEVSIAFVSNIMTEINDALIRRAVELAQEALLEEGWKAPAAGFCWLALGSEGREEQLLRTDQDSALIFEDVTQDEFEAVQEYYLDLARRVTTLLFEAGFDYCPADMMACNPKWCLPLSSWKAQFSHWIEQPTPEAVMHSTIFFDFRPVYGRQDLSEALTEFIFRTLDSQELFLALLAKNAQENPPPLTFFRNFMVEKSGEHKDEFDIKARAMMPLTDAARVLILEARVSKVNNTFRRFEHLAALEPQNRELFEQAAEAYEMLMRYRTLQGLNQGDTGRYFDPGGLSKMERLNLRNSFRPIRELQSLLSIRFQTAYIH